jgi:hypothetical protein
MGFRNIAASIGTTDTLITKMPAFFNGAAVLAIANTASTARTLTLGLRRSGQLSIETIGVIAVDATSSVKYGAPIGLEPGDELFGSCPTANVIKVSGSLVDGSQALNNFALQDLFTARFTWDAATASPAAAVSNTVPTLVTNGLYDMMRGCVVSASGAVNYFLNPTDWSTKLGGGASTLTGADGDVMVQIPAFYYRESRSGTVYNWEVSPVELPGFDIHPAFVKDGVRVPYRYYSAYDACVLDVSASAYVGGLNLDNNTANVDLTATTGDKLASVKGQFPMVGLTRSEFRTLAANTGAPWRQLDFALWSAVQMLYLVENQTFSSQSVLGAGNTNGSYIASSADQNDSPHTIAGAGDAIGGGSTDTTSGAGVNAKPGVSFMKYRGIENLYGNPFKWADGINVNVSATGNVHFTNNKASFADNTASGHTLLTGSLPTASGFIRDLLPVNGFFLSSLNEGAGSTTFITDQHFASASSNRVVRVGGLASDGAIAGVFCVNSALASSSRGRNIGARLCL